MTANIVSFVAVGGAAAVVIAVGAFVQFLFECQIYIVFRL